MIFLIHCLFMNASFSFHTFVIFTFFFFWRFLTSFHFGQKAYSMFYSLLSMICSSLNALRYDLRSNTWFVWRTTCRWEECVFCWHWVMKIISITKLLWRLNVFLHLKPFRDLLIYNNKIIFVPISLNGNCLFLKSLC